MNLILASSSRYRHQLMRSLRFEFTTEIPDINETAHPDEDPRELTLRLARQKAEAIHKRQPDSVVIGSDQVGVFDTQILTKPITHAVARAQLKKMRGQTIDFWTSLAVIGPNGELKDGVARTIVQLRRYSDSEIENYLALDQPYDCAGSFKSESLGLLLFESVESSDPSALMGMPMIMLAKYLREFGLNPLERLA